MLQKPELFPMPIRGLWLRLPSQVALLALIAWGRRQLVGLPTG